ncbi:MAG: DUF473 domain-containing protein [Methanosarcinales archaeon]|nr:DUF473 domain-containing protein [Methanosarcinales archaeon]
MKYMALTGISSQVLTDLQNNRIRSIEIHSPHNFFTIHDAKTGSLVFLTKTSYSDINTGTIGLIARINQRQIAIHRLVQSTDQIYEEYETYAARLQLEFRGIGRVRRIEQAAIGKPYIVEVDEVNYLEAK